MPVTRSATPQQGYREWRNTTVTVAGQPRVLASKPGVFSHARVDPAAVLLAERVTVGQGEVVVQMNCGNGLFGAVAAERASQVLLTDRNITGAEAARRTLAGNHVTNATVVLGHGSYALPHELRADTVAIRIPHERLALLQLLWDAFRILNVGGRCYLAGATNEGAKTAAKTMERLFGNAGVLAVHSGHRIVAATKRSHIAEPDERLLSPYLDRDTFHELHVTLRGRAQVLHTRPGVFSWDHLDEATGILADAMEIQSGQSVLDLGCGCGALGVAAAALTGTGQVTMVDADIEAIRSATRSAAAAGVTTFDACTSDVALAVLERRFDVVVTNPPFHVGKATDLTVPLQFIHDAFEVLSPQGRLFLVANRTLPYERAIYQRFGNIATVHDGPRFKVLSAARTP